MRNAIEKAAIAKNVADYIIDHLLVDEPMSITALEPLAREIADDRGITDANELEEITQIVMDYISSDRRVKVESRNRILRIFHK